MAHFGLPNDDRIVVPTRNQYLDSTRNLQFQSYTCARTSVTPEGWTNQEGVESLGRILQSGEVLAKITSAAGTSTADDVDKVGPYQLGVTDGRQLLANIVGVNETYVPWQLNERDVDIAALWHGTVRFAWCTIRDADGKRIPMTTAVADALYGKRGLDVNSK